MILFGTGHRPEDCDVDRATVRHLSYVHLRDTQPDVVLSGMASGFDLILGEVAYDLGIELWTVRPWADHSPRRIDTALYNKLENHATRHIIVNDSLSYPGPWVYQKRNEWMVDNADEGVAFWSGKESGGTYNCLRYAEAQNKSVTNIYPL